MKAEHKAEVTALGSQIETLQAQLRTERSEFSAKLRETELTLAKNAQVGFEIARHVCVNVNGEVGRRKLLSSKRMRLKSSRQGLPWPKRRRAQRP